MLVVLFFLLFSVCCLSTCREGKSETDKAGFDFCGFIMEDSPINWADLVSQSLFSEENAAEVPEALSFLESRGTIFKPVKDVNNGAIRKNLSVYFAVDTVVSSNDIVYAFDAAGIDVDEISCIQRKASNNSWIVSFRSLDAKQQALALPSLSIAGVQVFVGDCEHVTTIVKIYESPSEMPDTLLIGRLSHYGKVLSFRRDLATNSIENGIRTARIQLSKHIPSSCFISGETVFFWYPSQPRTCRRCGEEGHVARTCINIRCHNCEEIGHRIQECTGPGFCSICRESTHSSADCPFLIFSANVESSHPAAPTYAEATKQVGEPAATLPQEKQAANAATTLPQEKQKQVKPTENPDPVRSEVPVNEEPKDKKKDCSKQRDKDRDHDRDHDHDRDRVRDRDRDRRKDRDRDHDRTRDYERDRDRERDSDRRDRDYNKDRRRDRDRYSSRKYYPSYGHSTSDDDDDDWQVVSHSRRKERSRSTPRKHYKD